ncbi:MAG: polymerase subunit beta [Candidatus Marinimicrobia bacterium]|jgi:DNA polymerase-3 subunit beta|nr:polymerase subunit beta [Candidatus Neomarinimicrobiota bacterium]
MNFTVSKNDLYQSLQKVSKVTPVRSTLPILSCILVTAEDGELRFRSTDLEITMETFCKADVEERGSIAIPGRMILDITSELPETELTFSVKNESIEIKTPQGGEYRITGRSSAEFTGVPLIDDSTTILFSTEKLQRMIEKTIFSVSHDEMKASLNGVLFQFRKNFLRGVATDGHKLVQLTYENFVNNTLERDVIIPVKFLNVCLANIKNIDEVRFKVGKNHVMLETEESVVYTRIIEERFPDYESVIPVKNPNKVLVDIDTFLSAIKRIAIFSNKNTHQIALTFNENKVVISTEDVETASTAKEELTLSYEGEPLTIGYNAEYLKEVIRHIDGERAKIFLNTPLSAGLFYPEEQLENENLLILLMPIRL